MDEYLGFVFFGEDIYGIFIETLLPDRPSAVKYGPVFWRVFFQSQETQIVLSLGSVWNSSALRLAFSITFSGNAFRNSSNHNLANSMCSSSTAKNSFSKMLRNFSVVLQSDSTSSCIFL